MSKLASKNGKKDIDAYIAKVSPAARPMLKKIRAAIKAAAPQAEERISYGMPYYGYRGRLAYFAAFTNHVSLFAVPSRKIQATFSLQLKPYQTGKSTLQFPIGSKVPVVLIQKLVKARIKENMEKRKA